jgi:hypothetical protein
MSARIRISQIVSRVRSGVSDMSYAQRRVFENRTGIATAGDDRRSGSSGHGRGPAVAGSISELESLYAQDVRTGWR